MSTNSKIRLPFFLQYRTLFTRLIKCCLGFNKKKTQTQQTYENDDVQFQGVQAFINVVGNDEHMAKSSILV